jgi:hypothetical protein
VLRARPAAAVSRLRFGARRCMKTSTPHGGRQAAGGRWTEPAQAPPLPRLRGQRRHPRRHALLVIRRRASDHAAQGMDAVSAFNSSADNPNPGETWFAPMRGPGSPGSRLRPCVLRGSRRGEGYVAGSGIRWNLLPADRAEVSRRFRSACRLWRPRQCWHCGPWLARTS